MQHYKSLDDVRLDDVWLTIGSFDGVHRGHQSIIHELTKGAKDVGLPSVVITFFPHPAAILRGKNYPYYLNTPEEKADLFEMLGVNHLITHPFNRKIANKSAEAFINDIKKCMNIHHIQVGYDFAMGKNRDGDFSALKNLGKQDCFTVGKSPPLEESSGVISSSRIRFLLGVGQVEEAAQLLGRHYSINGLVEMGDQRGRTLGYPTANLSVWSEKIIPTAGVYACWAQARGKRWRAVTNIGVRPTFETSPVPPRVESHLLGFDEDIYGERINITFIARIRDEQRFSSVEDLIAQIRKDSETARNLLST